MKNQLKKTDRKKNIWIKGMPLEHVVELNELLPHMNTNYSHLLNHLVAEFLTRVRKYQAQLDQGKSLKLDHDLAKYSALCLHTWDDRPFLQYLENDKKPENKRTVWTWKPEIVTEKKEEK